MFAIIYVFILLCLVVVNAELDEDKSSRIQNMMTQETCKSECLKDTATSMKPKLPEDFTFLSTIKDLDYKDFQFKWKNKNPSPHVQTFLTLYYKLYDKHKRDFYKIDGCCDIPVNKGQCQASVCHPKVYVSFRTKNDCFLYNIALISTPCSGDQFEGWPKLFNFNGSYYEIDPIKGIHKYTETIYLPISISKSEKDFYNLLKRSYFFQIQKDLVLNHSIQEISLLDLGRKAYQLTGVKLQDEFIYFNQSKQFYNYTRGFKIFKDNTTSDTDLTFDYVSSENFACFLIDKNSNVSFCISRNRTIVDEDESDYPKTEVPRTTRDLIVAIVVCAAVFSMLALGFATFKIRKNWNAWWKDINNIPEHQSAFFEPPTQAELNKFKKQETLEHADLCPQQKDNGQNLTNDSDEKGSLKRKESVESPLIQVQNREDLMEGFDETLCNTDYHDKSNNVFSQPSYVKELIPTDSGVST